MSARNGYLIVLISLSAIILTHQGCSGVNFNSAKQSVLGADGTGSNGGGPSVCNPFGGTGSTSSKSGLVANGVYYIETSGLSANANPFDVIGDTVEGFFTANNPGVGFFNANVFLSALNFPAMYFSQGFTDSSGDTLKASDGSTLIQYFGFRATSVFGPGSWAPGDYQIAVISDDGSILTLSGGLADGSDLVVNNDGLHSMQMACGASPLHVTANSAIPLTFDYIQGPPVTIGFVMLYRPVSVAGSAVDPLCGQGGNNDSYFFLDHDANNNPISPSLAQAPYQQLTGPFDPTTGTGGWQVVEPAHFTLPGSVQNNCH